MTAGNKVIVKHMFVCVSMLGVLSTKLVCGMSRADVDCLACCVLKIVLSQSSDNNDNFATVLVLVCSKVFVNSNHPVLWFLVR